MKPTVKILPIAKLILDDNNANKGTKRGATALEKSLRKLGAGRSILVDKNNRVIAGNKTLEQARKAGMKNIAVIVGDPDTLVAVQRADLDLKKDKKAKELAVADNRVGELDLEWNLDVLKSLNIDLSDLWNDAELRKLGLGGDVVEAPEAQMDKADELQKKWKTARGQIWEIGKHRLMCGDSAGSDVEKLMRSKTVDACITDPPYGVEYQRSQSERGGNESVHSSYQETNGADGLGFLEFVPSDVIVMSYPVDRHLFELSDRLRAAKFDVRKELVWVKDTFSFWPGSHYQQRHEPILVIARTGKPVNYDVPANESTVLEYARPKAHELHPTAKPIELWHKLVKYHAKNSCYDPFSGSGTTLVACELSGRSGYAVEIHPKYVAVALERLSEMGLKPKLAKSLPETM